jgi:hypothetical protein
MTHPYKVDAKTGVASKLDDSIATQAEVDDLDKKTDEYFQKDALIKQRMFSMITDRLLLHVQKLKGAALIWEEIRDIHEGKTELVQIDLRCWLQDLRCEEGGDAKTHLSELL